MFGSFKCRVISSRSIAVLVATCAALSNLSGIAGGPPAESEISSDASGIQPSRSAARGHLAVALSRKKINFGRMPAGTESDPQTVTLTNKSKVELAAPVVNVTGAGFNLGSNGCTSAIPAAGTCPVSVTFKPPSKGKFKHGLLRFKDAAANSPQTVKLVGIGLSGYAPTATATAAATATPTEKPTATLTAAPTAKPTATPTATATATPTTTPTAKPTTTPTAKPTATPTAKPTAKAWVDTNNHVNYGGGGPTFPVVIYDMNANPINDVPALALTSFDTLIGIKVGSVADEQDLVNALPGTHVWSVVPNGVKYVGTDPGFPAELRNFIGGSKGNVTGYYVCDEPQTASEIATCNGLTNSVRGIDSGSLPNSTFNDATFGGGYPNYGGGSFTNFISKVLAVDPYGNNSWNVQRPESNGHYNFTSEVKTWLSFAIAAFPNSAVGCFTAFYNGACFPTKREMYDAMWSCIVNNADYAGLWAYGEQVSGASSCDGSPSETAAQRWADATEMINHFAAIKDVFIQPPAAAVSSVTQPQSVIGWRALQRTDGTVWIFASNYTSSAVNDTFTLSGAWGSIVAYADNSDSSDRVICMQPLDPQNCTTFTDSFPLFSSHVYKLSP